MAWDKPWKLSWSHNDHTFTTDYKLTLADESAMNMPVDYIRELVCRELAHRIAEDYYEQIVAEIKAPELVPLVIAQAVKNLAEEVEKLKWGRR